MSFAILRFEKLQANAITSIEAHHERQKEKYNSNPDIDTNKSINNYHFKKPADNYNAEIEINIKNSKCKIRKNSVKLVDTLITSGNEFFLVNSEKEYFKKAYEFMCNKIGEENIVSAVVHLDEKTPHMHLTFVPLTSDKRLSAKEVIGNRAKLKKWQDEFYSHMKDSFDDIERGKSIAETNRKHIPVELLKKAGLSTSQLEKLQKAFNDFVSSDMQNDDGFVEMLATLLPNVQLFFSELNMAKQKLDSDLSQFDKAEKALTQKGKELIRKEIELIQKEKSITAKLDSANNIYKKPFDDLQVEHSKLKIFTKDLIEKNNRIINAVMASPPEVIAIVKEKFHEVKDENQKTIGD